MQTVHRAVEQQTARQGDLPALATPHSVTTYRELNARANVLARHLIAGGFRRGDRAVIALPASIELLIAELAVLKAGGAYARPTTALAYTVTTPFSILRDGVAHGIEIVPSLNAAPMASPNLPVLVRATDSACVLADARGALSVEVAHSTIEALNPVPPSAEWSLESEPFEHWAVLMRGGTLTTSELPLRFAA